jgi:beta-catenin-like protein 1
MSAPGPASDPALAAGSGPAADDVGDGALDDAAARRLVGALSRAAAANALARAKYARDPARVAPSELALHDAVSALGPLPTQPALYAAARDAGVVASLAGLLAHENVDVAADALALLVDFVDPDGEEDDAPHRAFVGEVVESGAVDAVVAALRGRLAAAGEEGGGAGGGDDAAVLAAAALSAMSVLENAVELRPDLAGTLGGRCGLVRLCVDEAGAGCGGFSERRAAAAEVLALLLQSEASNREAFGAADGVETLLRAVAPYRRAGGGVHGDEAEMAANMFGVLCAALLECPANKAAFCRAEGVELMLLFVRTRRSLREPALKALDFACTGSEENAGRVFDAGGIGVLFAVLMTLWASTEQGGEGRADGARDRKAPRKVAAPTDGQRSEAEHLLAVLFSLYRYGGDAERARLTGKFTEASGAKARRLLVLYADRIDADWASTDSDRSGSGDDGASLAADVSSAFVLQLCAVLIAQVCAAGGPSITRAISGGLATVGGLERVSRLVRRFARGMDDDKDAEENVRVVRLADALDEAARVGAPGEDGVKDSDVAGDDARVAAAVVVEAGEGAGQGGNVAP